jgi:hypothetical protein
MSQQLTPEQRQAIEQIYMAAAALMKQGYSRHQIVKELESRGLERSIAQTVVDRLEGARSDAYKDAAMRAMGMGALICIIGLAVTFCTYSGAASSRTGGSYVVAYGAIIGGAFQFFRGLYYYSQN